MRNFLMLSVVVVVLVVALGNVEGKGPCDCSWTKKGCGQDDGTYCWWYCCAKRVAETVEQGEKDKTSNSEQALPKAGEDWWVPACNEVCPRTPAERISCCQAHGYKGSYECQGGKAICWK